MVVKGIRGAITIENNTKEDIEKGVIELLTELTAQNNIIAENISHAIFTTTKDINADFPAKYARTKFGWDNVPMMCFNELDVPDSLEKCIRVLVVLNCEKDFNAQFVYLKGAANLRK